MFTLLTTLLISPPALAWDELTLTDVALTRAPMVPGGYCPSCWVLQGAVEVADLAWDKDVEVWYQAGFSAWQVADAHFVADGKPGRELWNFSIATGYLSDPEVRIAVRYASAGHVWWDNDYGRDHVVVPEIGRVPWSPVALMQADVGFGCAGMCGQFQAEVRIEELAWDKEVDLFYAVDGGGWQVTPLHWSQDDAHDLDHERWEVALQVPTSRSEVRFAVRYRADGQEWWDNRGGLDHVR